MAKAVFEIRIVADWEHVLVHLNVEPLTDQKRWNFIQSWHLRRDIQLYRKQWSTVKKKKEEEEKDDKVDEDEIKK